MATDKTAGLEGMIAGDTTIATVGKEGKGLTYRGYSIYDLAEQSTFEEVAYLLIYGRLPNQTELNNYKTLLHGQRALPAALKTVLEQIPAYRGTVVRHLLPLVPQQTFGTPVRQRGGAGTGGCRPRANSRTGKGAVGQARPLAQPLGHLLHVRRHELLLVLPDV